jgi:O-antigen/teichoic acid export membrane protein
MDSVSRPTLQLVLGRSIGLAASFAIGVILARLFEPAAFGVYKQFFLVYATLYGVLQLGMAESLYYFVPRGAAHTARYVANAIVTLLAVGLASTVGLYAARSFIAAWLTPELAAHVLPLGVFLTCMLASTVLEIVLISERRHRAAAATYAVSDIVRTLLFLAPALLFFNLGAVFMGASAFAVLRLATTIAMLWRAFGRELRIDLLRWREQLAYALPFAAAVGIEVVLINYHQYVVAARFDAATFAIYAVGCLQIPLYDLIVTSTVTVFMVRMADAPHGDAARALWHDTVCRLAFLIFPLVALLFAGAHHLIVGLFTETYAASIPIFVLWTLTMLPAVMAVDAMLRVYAQTRFLLVMNLARFVCVAGLIGASVSSMGLNGAVLVTLLALTVTKTLGLVRIATVLGIGVPQLLPWRRLAGIAAIAVVSVVPAIALQRLVDWPPLLTFVVSAAAYASTYALLSCARGSAGTLRMTGAPVGHPEPVQRTL